MSWPDAYIGPDSMTHWIIEKSQGITNMGLFRISESVRAYARSRGIGNMGVHSLPKKPF